MLLVRVSIHLDRLLLISGAEVTKILARDSDSGDYGKITYLLDRISSLVRISACS